MITQSQFEAFRQESIEKQPIRKTILLSDLTFHTMDAVSYAGVTLGLTRSALKDIVRIIGFNAGSQENFRSALGEEGAINVLNSLKSIIGSIKKEVQISVTPDRIISRVTPKNGASGISAQTYFDTFDRLANDHNLNIQSTHFNPETGAVSISAIADNHEFQVGNLSDEVFSTGINLSLNQTGIKVDPYMHRLVCTNGMVTRMFEESYQLGSMDKRTWESFYQHLERIEKMGFVPQKFNSAVLSARETPASLAELERGIHLLTTNSKIPEAELEIFFQGLKRTYQQFNSVGIDTTQLTNAQKRNSRTALSNWDVINGITDFASHNYGYEKKSGADRHLQMIAGDMLAKGPDTANLVLNQPF